MGAMLMLFRGGMPQEVPMEGYSYMEETRFDAWCEEFPFLRRYINWPQGTRRIKITVKLVDDDVLDSLPWTESWCPVALDNEGNMLARATWGRRRRNRNAPLWNPARWLPLWRHDPTPLRNLLSEDKLSRARYVLAIQEGPSGNLEVIIYRPKRGMTFMETALFSAERKREAAERMARSARELGDQVRAEVRNAVDSADGG